MGHLFSQCQYNFVILLSAQNKVVTYWLYIYAIICAIAENTGGNAK